jgi:uncharacterized protein YciI
MLYAIIWDDVEDSLALRLSVREQHLERVTDLIHEGRLIIGGPFPSIDAEDPGPAGFTGSLIIAEFASQREAEVWIADDPYAKIGLFKNLTIKPFVKVVP